MTLFSFTRFCLRVLADLNEIIRRLKRNVILTIAIDHFSSLLPEYVFCRALPMALSTSTWTST